MNNLKYIAAGSGIPVLLSLGVITWCFGPSPMKADPPAVDTADGKPVALRAGSLILTPMPAASVASPATGKTLFVDAATGKLSAKDSTGTVVVLELTAPTPTSTPTPSPTPTPSQTTPPAPAPNPTPPLPSTPDSTGRQLLGGWQAANPFGRGSIAIDWSTKTMAMVGHTQRNEILLFDLPAMGTGTDSKQWPVVKPREVVAGWWPKDCYASGLTYWKGDLWVSPRKFYDTNPPGEQTWYSRKGQTVHFKLPRQQFNGMVKRLKDDPWPGGGGYESGQGSAFGPTLADLSGGVKITHTFDAGWDSREKREPNYWPAGRVDGWTALNPRVVNGEKEGRWACDKIYAGGLVLEDGIRFWPQMGIGDIDYARQNDTFAATNKTYEYVYDPASFKLLRWVETPYPTVYGQEFGPNGEVVLSQGNVWKSDVYQVDPVVAVYTNPKAKTPSIRSPAAEGKKPDDKK
jgi:hypothetical protein